jgi:DNA adenine methylase
MALIRYPGSKAKLWEDLQRFFPDEMRHSLWSTSSRWEYREPFFGSGEYGLRVLKHLDIRCRVWLNDIDPDLVCMWQSVHKDPVAMLKFVSRFKPSVDAFYQFKEQDGNGVGSIAERGFRKLALHRMSVSGFGFKSGGPIGGRSQTSSEYTVDCRWNPERIKVETMRLHKHMNKFEHLRITCGDFGEMVETAPIESFVYLDPPYYEKGPQLYKFPMTEADHARLASLLQDAKCQWVLSYDDHAEIRRLYDWAQFRELEVLYTNAVATGERPKNREVAIMRRSA